MLVGWSGVSWDGASTSLAGRGDTFACESGKRAGRDERAANQDR